MPFGVTNLYVVNDAKDLQPSGSTIPTAPAVLGTAGDIQEQNVEINSILCSASAAATVLAAFDDLIGTELKAAIEAYITNTLKVDLTGNTVDYNCKVFSIARGNTGDGIFLNDATQTYFIKTKLTVGYQ